MKISIITVAYNAAKTIEETIKSVLNQTYGNIEYIVIDGNSTDGTQQIIERYNNKIAHYTSEADNGIYSGMNKGLAVATGEYIGMINADDLYADSSIIDQVVKLLSKNKVDALYGNLEYVSENNTQKVIRNWNSGPYNRKRFMKGWMPPHPTFFVKSNCYIKYGNFDESFKISADYELMLRFLYKHNLTVSYLPKTMIKMRVGGVSNSSIKNRIQANMEDRKAWKINRLKPEWFTLTAKPISKLFQFFVR